MNFMRDVLSEFQEETGNIYNLEATPAENTTYRFARPDTVQYPVIHVFTGENNITAASAKNFVRKITNSFHLPYITLSPTFSICPSHGYISGEHFECPHCGSKSEVFSTIVGYMRPVSQWNVGKRQEFNDRILFGNLVKENSEIVSTDADKEEFALAEA